MAGIKDSSCVHDEISIDAEWWLPESPAHRVRGEFSGSIASNFYLEVEGSLEGDFNHQVSNLIILGESHRGEKYTLLQCFCFNQSTFSNTTTNGTNTKYFVHWLLKGYHFSKYEELLFDRISFGMSNFEEWHGVKPFQFESDNNENQTSVVYTKPQETIILSNEILSASIDYIYQPSRMSLAQKTATIEHSARIRINAVSKPLPLADFPANDSLSFFESMERIRAFIEFATQKTVWVYDIKAYPKKRGSSDSTLHKPIEIQRIINIESNPEPVLFLQMLFTWKHLEHDPKKYFQAWFDKIKPIGMPVWLYLGSFNKQIYLDQRFMELAQGLEGFHRYLFPSASAATEEHKQKIDSITTVCPAEHQRWLKQKSSYSHEPSLRKRLKELFSQHEDIISWLLGSKKNATILISTIVDARNQYAHCLDSCLTASPPNKRFDVTIKMQAVFGMLLLKESGFTDNQIQNIIQHNWRYSQLQERNSS